MNVCIIKPIPLIMALIRYKQNPVSQASNGRKPSSRNLEPRIKAKEPVFIERCLDF